MPLAEPGVSVSRARMLVRPGEAVTESAQAPHSAAVVPGLPAAPAAVWLAELVPVPAVGFPFPACRLPPSPVRLCPVPSAPLLPSGVVPPLLARASAELLAVSVPHLSVAPVPVSPIVPSAQLRAFLGLRRASEPVPAPAAPGQPPLRAEVASARVPQTFEPPHASSGSPPVIGHGEPFAAAKTHPVPD